MQMLRAYLDTNVYSALADEGQIPAEDQAGLKAALAQGALVAPVSLANIDELLGGLDSDRPATIRRLKLMRGLVGFHGMLKQPRDLLRDAIEAYAAGVEAPPVTLPEPERRKVVLFLADVLAGSTRHDQDLKQIVDGVGGLKGTWLASMLDAQRRALTDPELPPREVRWGITFEEFFDSVAQDLAEAFAESQGCADACRARGLACLVRVPAVRLCVGVSKSQIYAQLVGTPGQPDLRRPARSDGYDVWHAILASTAEVFLTLDSRLADHVERVPDVGVRVTTSVRDLLVMLEEEELRDGH
jgi:hypothetical protein